MAEMMSFEEARKRHPELAKENGLGGKPDRGKFILITTETKEPVIIDMSTDKSVSDSIIIHAEKNSKATIIEKVSAKGKGIERSCAVQLYAKENSSISYIIIYDTDDSYHDSSKRHASVERNARVDWLECSPSGNISSTTVTDLKGEGASSRNFGMFYGNGSQNMKLHVETVHSAPHTTCSMLARGVLDGNAKADYRGMITIESCAPNSAGYQKEDTLLLSESARMDAVPMLEIRNKDVKCSHGTSIGQVDRDKLFYMMSRGLDEETAKKIIVSAFFDPVLKHIEDEGIRQYIMSIVSKKAGIED